MATSNKKKTEPTVPETSSEANSVTYVNAGATEVEGSQPEIDPNAVTIAEMEGDESPKAKNIIGDFEVMKVLGKGGMGTVYLAKQISLDRLCALKVMSKELNAKTNFVIRFQREAKLMARIDHANVVKCFAIGKDNGLHHVAMEYIDGKSMKDWVKQLKRLSIPDAIHVTLACADALAHAHRLNMIHRDIKPDNILVTNKGEVKVADLGLAKELDDELQMTQTGTGLGTPYYMAPEQARNARDVNGQCDIYALGCSLYNFVTGRLPFKADSTLNLIIEKEKGIFESASKSNPEVPEKLDLIIDKMMAKKLEVRYKTCEEVIKDLESLGRHSTSLSFIDSPDRVEMNRNASSASKTVKIPESSQSKTRRRSDNLVAPSSSKKSSRQRSSSHSGEHTSRKSKSGSGKPALPPDTWYVRHVNSQGKPVVAKLKTEKIRQALKSGKLDLRTQVRKDANKPFLPIAQFHEFDAEISSLEANLKAEKKGRDLSEQYAKLDKQYQRRKLWYYLRLFKEGTLGWIGLVIWLCIIAAGCYGLYLLWPYLRDFIADTLGGLYKDGN